MGTIVCRNCQKVIEHFNEVKVTTLYSTCPTCNENKKSK